MPPLLYQNKMIFQVNEHEESTKSLINYLEDMTSVFLAVRDFARVERNKIVKTNKATKQSSSNKIGNSFQNALLSQKK